MPKKRTWLVYVVVVGVSVSITFAIQTLYPRVYSQIAGFYSVRHVKTAIRAHHDELYENSASAVLGDPQAKTTIVEFFDYRCPHCEAAARTLDHVLPSNPQLRVILLDYPILGPDSEYAARMALAVGRHGKYTDFYRAMFLRDPWKPDRSAIDQAVTQVGLDPSTIRSESQDPVITETIQRNKSLAGDLLIQGTPSFIIGDKVEQGELSEGQFKQDVSGLQQVAGLTAGHQ